MTDTAASAERRTERSATKPTLLIVSAVEKGYRERGLSLRRRPVLRAVDLRLASGEVVGLVGENGSGKSTLLKVLVGSLAPDAGSVSLSGSLGYCPQEPVLYERLTCDEHMELFARAYRMSAGDAARSRDDLYATLGFARYASTRAGELSGGTRAKLNLAIALLPDPQVLLLDEPYAGFDFDTYLRFWDVVAERKERGRSVLIVSHFVADTERFDRLVELRDGMAIAR